MYNINQSDSTLSQLILDAKWYIFNNIIYDALFLVHCRDSHEWILTRDVNEIRMVSSKQISIFDCKWLNFDQQCSAFIYIYYILYIIYICITCVCWMVVHVHVYSFEMGFQSWVLMTSSHYC